MRCIPDRSRFVRLGGIFIEKLTLQEIRRILSFVGLTSATFIRRTSLKDEGCRVSRF